MSPSRHLLWPKIMLNYCSVATSASKIPAWSSVFVWERHFCKFLVWNVMEDFMDSALINATPSTWPSSISCSEEQLQVSVSGWITLLKVDFVPSCSKLSLCLSLCIIWRADGITPLSLSAFIILCQLTGSLCIVIWPFRWPTVSFLQNDASHSRHLQSRYHCFMHDVCGLWMSKLSLIPRRTNYRSLKLRGGFKYRDIGDLALLNIWCVAGRKAAKWGSWDELGEVSFHILKSDRLTWFYSKVIRQLRKLY